MNLPVPGELAQPSSARRSLPNGIHKSGVVVWPTFGLPRVALRKQEAAQALGVSDETFDRYVKPHVRIARVGSLRLYPVPELARFLEAHASLPLGENDTGYANPWLARNACKSRGG